MKCLIAISLLLAVFIQAEETIQKDPETGLVKAKNWQFVKLHCTYCHSAAIVTQNRMDRKTWKKTIRWMQQNHGLWPLGQNEPFILDYLAENYAPQNSGRRPNLPANLMPPVSK